MKTKFFASILLCCLCVISISSASAEDKTLVFSTCDWPPFYAENLKNYGFLCDITEKALNRVGYAVTIKFMPWKRAVDMAKKGKYDGIPGLYYTKERAEFFVYSEPLFRCANVFITRKDTEIKYSNIQDLKPYKIGVLRGSSYGELFDKADFLDKEFTSNSTINIKKLYKKRYNVIVESREVFLSKINTELSQFKDSYKILHPPVEETDIFIAISKKNKDHQKIIEDVNRGLKMIKEDGTYNKILQSHGM